MRFVFGSILHQRKTTNEVVKELFFLAPCAIQDGDKNDADGADQRDR
jgi:hypothetical protein